MRYQHHAMTERMFLLLRRCSWSGWFLLHLLCWYGSTIHAELIPLEPSPPTTFSPTPPRYHRPITIPTSIDNTIASTTDRPRSVIQITTLVPKTGNTSNVRTWQPVYVFSLTLCFYVCCVVCVFTRL
jgi:hypothetical protein